jgi:hypothetical protein
MAKLRRGADMPIRRCQIKATMYRPIFKNCSFDELKKLIWGVDQTSSSLR